MALAPHLDLTVLGHARPSRDQLADDHVLFQAEQRIVLAFDSGLGEDARRLLEGRRRQERLCGQRRLRDAEQHRVRFRRLAPIGRDLDVDLGELLVVEHLARQQRRVARIGDLLLAQHAAHDHFDVLVVDVHALAAIDLLHFLDEVVLQRGLALDAQDVVRVHRAFAQLVAGRHAIAVVRPQVHVEGDLVDVLFAFGIGHHDLADAPVLLDVDGAALFSDDRLALGLARFEQLLDARQTGDDILGRHTAGVEGAQRELRAWLADRLRRDDAHRLADVDFAAGGEIAPVADRAHADHRVACQHGADADRVDARRDDARRLVLVDLFAALDDHVALVFGVDDVRQRVAPHDAVDQRLDDLAAHSDIGHRDAIVRVAVLFAHDDVLGDVHQPAGQVARVGGAQRSVGETLARAVRRDEVLEHREALFEVGLDRNAQDAAGRVGHKAAHAGDLLDLRDGTARARGRHHEDGVEPVLLLEHGLRDLFAGARPHVDRLVVLFVVREQTGAVQVVDRSDLRVGVGDQLRLLLGDDDVHGRHGRAGHRRETEAERLDGVEETSRLRVAVMPVAVGDERGEPFLVDRLVDERMVPRLWERLVEDDPADRRLDELVLPAHLDRLVQRDRMQIIRDLRFLRAEERARVRRAVAPLFGLRRAGNAGIDRQVVQSQHHVLSGDGHRTAVRRL